MPASEWTARPRSASGVAKIPVPTCSEFKNAGNTLTFAILPLNYHGVFTADLIKTLPDLQATAPYLNAKNSGIFMADGGIIEQVRLSVVEGQSTESTDVATF